MPTDVFFMAVPLIAMNKSFTYMANYHVVDTLPDHMGYFSTKVQKNCQLFL